MDKIDLISRSDLSLPGFLTLKFFFDFEEGRIWLQNIVNRKEDLMNYKEMR